MQGGAALSIGLLTLLVLAVSIDGFSAGLSFGLRRLVIPLYSLLIISLLSSLSAASSMLLGSRIALLIPVSLLGTAGGVMLIGLGLYIAVTALKQRGERAAPEQGGAGPKKSGGLQILASISESPDRADLDHSGELSAKEAALLGLVLSADVFGAGIGASLIGLPVFLTSLAAGAAQLLLISLGAELGRLISGLAPLRNASLWAGFILILVGLFNIL